MDKIALKRHVSDQLRIVYWGTPVGYCTDKPNRPVNFLKGKWDILNVEERADVIEYVIERVGSVRRTPQTREAFDVIDRRYSEREGSRGKGDSVS